MTVFARPKKPAVPRMRTIVSNPHGISRKRRPVAKKPSPGYMLLEFDKNFNPLPANINSKKYSKATAKRVRAFHDKLNTKYYDESYRKDTLKLHTPLSSPRTPGRTEEKILTLLEQTKKDDKEARFISDEEFRRAKGVKALFSEKAVEAGISETRAHTPDEKQNPKIVEFRKLVQDDIANRFTNAKTPTLRTRVDPKKELELIQANESISKPVSNDTIHARTSGRRATILHPTMKPTVVQTAAPPTSKPNPYAKDQSKRKRRNNHETIKKHGGSKGRKKLKRRTKRRR